jgi:hypothetical protein
MAAEDIPTEPVRPEARSRRVVLLRKSLDDLSFAGDGAQAAVAALAGRLGAGELLAVHTRADVTLTRPWEALVGPDLRALVCCFAPDDYELFLWRTPPELPEPAGVLVDGQVTVDVRDIDPPLAILVSIDAVARLLPGEALVHVGDRPPLLIADLLAGRAELSGPRWTDDGLRTRVVRRAAATGERPARDPSSPMRRLGSG